MATRPGVRRLLALVLAAVAGLGAAGHYTDPRVRAFTVWPDGSDSTVQRAEAAGGSARAVCELAYTTGAQDRIVARAASGGDQAEGGGPSGGGEAAARAVGEVLAPLRGTCLSKQVDYWDYEVCIGASIKQFHLPDIYPLGHFARWDGDTQLYTNGAACEASPSSEPRQVRLRFGCADSQFVSSVREVEVCVYEVVVGTPLVCSMPRFPRVVDEQQMYSQQASWDQPQNGPAETAPDDGSEDWMLRLSQLPDGRFACAAWTQEALALGSRLHFGQFELRLQIDGLPRPAAVRPAAYRRALLRAPGRLRIGAGEYETEHDPDGRRASVVRATKAFAGKVSYAEVFA